MSKSVAVAVFIGAITLGAFGDFSAEVKTAKDAEDIYALVAAMSEAKSEAESELVWEAITHLSTARARENENKAKLKALKAAGNRKGAFQFVVDHPEMVGAIPSTVGFAKDSVSDTAKVDLLSRYYAIKRTTTPGLNVINFSAVPADQAAAFYRLLLSNVELTAKTAIKLGRIKAALSQIED